MNDECPWITWVVEVVVMMSCFALFVGVKVDPRAPSEKDIESDDGDIHIDDL